MIQTDLNELQEKIAALEQEKASLIIRRTIEARLPAMRGWSTRPALVLGRYDPGGHEYRLAKERWTKRQCLAEKEE